MTIPILWPKSTGPKFKATHGLEADREHHCLENAEQLLGQIAGLFSSGPTWPFSQAPQNTALVVRTVMPHSDLWHTWTLASINAKRTSATADGLGVWAEHINQPHRQPRVQKRWEFV